MFHNNTEQVTGHGDAHAIHESDNDSEVDYPLIDLKTGLKNELIEKTLKELKRAANKSKKDNRSRASEFSHGVIGKNKSTQFALSKAVNYFFSEQEYILEKMKKAQIKTLQDLQKIHMDKRQQMRISYEYHNEETRQAVLKLKNEEQFLQKQEELEELMRLKKISINKLIIEQRNLMKETSLKLRKKLNKVPLITIEKETFPSITKTTENHLPDNSKVNNSNESNLTAELPKSRSFLQTKALEVTKDFLNPRTIPRNMDERPIGNVNSVVKSRKVSVDEDKPLSNIATKQHEQIHNFSINRLEIPEFVQEPEENHKYKSPKEIMKEHKLMKERELQEILALPYTAYRRNSRGKIVELDHPPTKKEFKEPSNKDKYKIRKELGEERNRYQESILNLTKTTENIIQEDIKKKDLLNAPKLELKKESVYQAKKIGPQHWMRAFVSSNIPDDIDPSSTEAIIYCRYIRAPLKDYSHLPDYLIYHTPL